MTNDICIQPVITDFYKCWLLKRSIFGCSYAVSMILVIEKLLRIIPRLVHILKIKCSTKYSFFRIVFNSNKCAPCFTTEQVTKGIFTNKDSDNEVFETSSD